MKKTIIILIAILLFSCKAKTVTVNTHTTDTLRVEKIVTITPAQLNNLIIDNPCDSLGNLRPFTLYTNTGKTSVKIAGKNNIITAFINIDSIKQSSVDTYKSNQTKEKQIIVKEITPKWVYKLIIYAIIVSILLLWKFGIFKLML